MTKTFEDLQKFSKEGVDAALESLVAASKGAQLLLGECADYARRSFEQGASAFEKLVEARNPERAVQVQGEFVRTAFEDFLAQAVKLSELYTDAVRQSCAPIETYLGKRTAAV